MEACASIEWPPRVLSTLGLGHSRLSLPIPRRFPEDGAASSGPWAVTLTSHFEVSSVLWAGFFHEVLLSVWADLRRMGALLLLLWSAPVEFLGPVRGNLDSAVRFAAAASVAFPLATEKRSAIAASSVDPRAETSDFW